MRIKLTSVSGSSVVIAALCALPAQARVTRIIIDRTATLTGQTIPYQTLTGRAFGELDPADPHNSIITDINLGKDADGKVRYIASFFIVTPVNLTQASGFLWHDVPNRGGRITIVAAERNLGDIGISSAWQSDNAGGTAVPANASSLVAVTPSNNEWVLVPVAKIGDGSTVTGFVQGRIINRPGPASQPLNVMGNPIPYLPAALDTTQATLRTRFHETINGQITEGPTIPSTDWAFAHCDATNPFPGTPQDLDHSHLPGTLPVHVCLKNGFDPTLLYELVYPVKDPYVTGVGFAAFRDVNSFFKNATKDDFGTANPIAGAVKWTVIRGVSQSGNATRAFIHLGFNQDEAGRQVHDGAWPIIAGRRVSLDSRWAQPDGVLELYQMGSEGPQWWKKWPDRVRDLPTRGILDRCQASRTCPKIVETFGGAEVFALKMTMSWVGTSADKDIPLPNNVRRYYLPSSTHGGGNGATTEAPGGLGAVNCPGNNWGKGTLRANPIPSTGLVNRIRAALHDWVLYGTEPPPSQWPTLAPIPSQKSWHEWDDDDDDGDHDRDDRGDHDGHHKHFKPTLVEPNMKDMGFPHGIPGIPDSIFTPESFIFPVFDYDWGPDFDESEANGVPTNAPPPIKHVIKMLVPRVDADGNELGGVPTVHVDAPLGTFLGWNITAGPSDVGYDGRPFHAGQVCNYIGGMVPFFKTKAQRLAAGDPRKSLEERYGTHQGYVDAVTKAANNAFEKGYLLAADRDALITQAVGSDVCNQPGDGGKCNPSAP